MNDINFGEEGFYIVFFALGSIGLLASGIWFTILGIQIRRNGRLHRREIRLSAQWPGPK